MVVSEKYLLVLYHGDTANQSQQNMEGCKRWKVMGVVAAVLYLGVVIAHGYLIRKFVEKVAALFYFFSVMAQERF